MLAKPPNSSSLLPDGVCPFYCGSHNAAEVMFCFGGDIHHLKVLIYSYKNIIFLCCVLAFFPEGFGSKPGSNHEPNLKSGSTEVRSKVQEILEIR